MFAYCGNNPISRSDSSGDWWHIVIGATVGATVSFTSSLVTGIIEDQSVDLVGAGISAVFGAVSGALAASGYGTAIQVSGGALLSGAENFVNQVRKDGIENVNYGKVLCAAVVGGVTSRGNGTGRANQNFLNSQADGASQRIVNAFKHDGIDAGFSEILSAGKYYFSQTATVFYKPLINDSISSITDDVSGSIYKSVAKSIVVSVY